VACGGQERWVGRIEERDRATGPALRRGLHLDHADLRGAVADTKTRWPAGFDAAAAGSSLEPTTTDGRPVNASWQ